MPIYIEMPKLSDTMNEGTLVKWLKKPGDEVEMGDVIAEVETDKATMEMEAFDDGVLGKYLVEEGAKVAVGSKIAVLVEEGEEVPEGDGSDEGEKPAKSEDKKDEKDEKEEKEEKEEKKPEADSSKEADGSGTSTPAKSPGVRVKASPLAKKVATQHGVDLTTLEGTGPGGRIVSKDVLHAATSGTSKSAPAAAAPEQPKPVVAEASAEDEKISLSGMRRTIAERLLASKLQIPHFYIGVEMDAAPLMKFRKDLNAAGEAAGLPKITVNDIVLMAAAKAAAAVPKVNASWAGDHVIQFGSVNLSVAVAVDEGLVTPVLRNADKLSLKDISAAVKDLAGRARSKKLKPEEYQGGTITVSNLGAYGIDEFYAIINPPQAMILAVGTVVKKPVVNEKDEIVPGMRMRITLSGDHRVVDGAVGAEYLNALKGLIESPASMLL